MAQTVLERAGVYALGAALSAAATLFGGFLIYEKAALPVLNGVTEERSGLTYRADEPIMFWISVSMFAIFGAVIALIGLWGFWKLLWPKPKVDD